MKRLLLLLALLLLPFSHDAQAHNDADSYDNMTSLPPTKVCGNAMNNGNKTINLIIESKELTTLTIIFLACFCALLAQGKGRRPALWLVLALLFNLFAVIILLCLRDLSGKKQLSK
ncbi:hypothetical protein V1358_00420 [Pseudoalteromonas sp. YIC-656]|uniref:hypothetical protein n=1 Tax=Pseudoalteromonas pernae TaxID=3118054 RepID=UPI0032422CAC